MAQVPGGPRIAPHRPGAMGVDVPPVVAARVRREFEEMPRLCLTLHQASRLLALNNTTCRQLLGSLVADRFLAHERGRYQRLKDA